MRYRRSARAACLFFALATATTAPVRAQDGNVPEEVVRLHRIEGEFVGMGTFTIGDEKIAVPVRSTNRIISGGYGVQLHERFEIPGEGTLEGISLMGFDHETEMLHMYSIMSSGDVHDHFGRWIDEESLSLQYAAPQAGRSFTELVPMSIESKDAYRFSTIVLLDGDEVARFDVRLEREQSLGGR